MEADRSSSPGLDPLVRFSDRVGDYVRYRPGYPPELIDCLRDRAGLGPGCSVADVGAGTGIFTRLLLQTGARVAAVEPNAAMRRAAEAELGRNPGFKAVEGTGEATGLPDSSVSLVTCAQAFHWLDARAARVEFLRILAPAGRCALIWNTSDPERSDFARGYERIKEEYGTDFGKVRHENKRAAEKLDGFFGRSRWEHRVFPNHQDLDLDGLLGRMRSSSYAPKEGHPAHAPMVRALEELFGRCSRNGLVRMEYDTDLYLGSLG